MRTSTWHHDDDEDEDEDEDEEEEEEEEDDDDEYDDDDDDEEYESNSIKPGFHPHSWHHFILPIHEVFESKKNKTIIYFHNSHAETQILYNLTRHGCFLKWWYPQSPPQNDHF